MLFAVTVATGIWFYNFSFYMCLPTVVGEEHHDFESSVRCPLTSVSLDATSLYLVEGL